MIGTSVFQLSQPATFAVDRRFVYGHACAAGAGCRGRGCSLWSLTLPSFGDSFYKEHLEWDEFRLKRTRHARDISGARLV
jgi:hypothetical protein